jgi:hypothetical protein
VICFASTAASRQRTPTRHLFIVEEIAMKIMMIAALVSIAATTGTAFAQPTPDSSSAQSAKGVTTFNNGATRDQNGQWVPPDGQPIASKTRAQVYNELVRSEEDGQLAYLNHTLYAHH